VGTAGPGASVEGGSAPVGPGVPLDPALAVSLDVTVVELTCRLPEDLRPLEEPEELGEC